MNLDWKKIGLIALFVGSVLLFAFLLYWFFIRVLFFSSNMTEPVATTTPGNLPNTVTIDGRIYQVDVNGQLTTAEGNQPLTITELPQTATDQASGGLTKTTKISQETAYFSTIDQNGNIIYYSRSKDKFYQISADGKVSEFNNKIFNNVRNVTWSNNRDLAILEYPDGSKIVYSFANNRQVTLPDHWEDFSFSPSDQQIVFKNMALDKENRYLAVANYDGSQAQVLEKIGGSENQFDANWSPNSQMAATFTEAKGGDRSEVYFIGLNNENFKSMTVEGRGFTDIWSPDGDKMIYSVYNNGSSYNPELWVVDATAETIGNNRKSLGLRTWADKCAFGDNNLVYCAVPESLPYGSGLEPAVANAVNDQIYQINLATGAKKLIAVPDGDYNVKQLFVDSQNNYLFLTDQNQQVYRLNL